VRRFAARLRRGLHHQHPAGALAAVGRARWSVTPRQGHGGKAVHQAELDDLQPAAVVPSRFAPA